MTKPEMPTSASRQPPAAALGIPPIAPIPPLPPRGDLRRRVLAGETTIGAFVNLGSIVAAELIARAGFDWALVDLEHGHATDADLLVHLHAIQTTATPALVRVPAAERIRVGRALDMGAEGLMIPRLETVADVSETTSWMRYPPDGVRGVALPPRGGGYGEVGHAEMRSINERVLGIFQVESPAAVAAAGAIAALDGVDVLFVGPADLSHAMGVPGQFVDAGFVAALDRVIAAARAHGKSAGILLSGADKVPGALAQGFTFVGVGSDSAYLIAGAHTTVREARAAIAARG